jgi:hypothetical protein
MAKDHTRSEQGERAVGVVQVKVVLVDPALRVLQAPPIIFTDRRQDSGGFAPFHNDHNLIGLWSAEGGVG